MIAQWVAAVGACLSGASILLLALTLRFYFRAQKRLNDALVARCDVTDRRLEAHGLRLDALQQIATRDLG